MTFFGILCGNNLSDLLPVSILKVLYELRILDHVSEESVLEQMSLIVLPLSECPQTLSRIFLLFEQLIEYLHGLLIWNYAFAIKLILSIFEPDHILKCIRCLHCFFCFATWEGWRRTNMGVSYGFLCRFLLWSFLKTIKLVGISLWHFAIRSLIFCDHILL